MIDISVIVPTFNRAKSLEDTLKSICGQTLSQNRYEVIVVDNSSTDNTFMLTEQFVRTCPNIRYVLEHQRGLLYCRHRGVKESRSNNILVFIDDDIIAEKNYLETILNTFEEHNDIVLVGGKVLPDFETYPPYWIKAFETQREGTYILSFLSLIDLGENANHIRCDFVFGCSFSIKKDALVHCGGFNPDSFPLDMLKYRGDGETGLCYKLERQGYKAFYNPWTVIRHKVPSSRLTIEYFCKRAYMEGVSWSFTGIRKIGRTSSYITTELYFLFYIFALVPFGLYKVGLRSISLFPVYYKVMLNFFKGYRFHRMEVLKDPGLLSYVLKDTFMTLP